ncbi:hypothetical protein BIW11_08303 [Tropilaelaps mercedesae]|uniref:Uncharacterized protein n=1 Tax=Tropilaelaps mercedesae TaxID=418985 RepID=A0A1V9XQ33_9ACAR|nr:hypothetical protein BIW11_08303 [Tropilaelaps mercedesae]
MNGSRRVDANGREVRKNVEDGKTSNDIVASIEDFAERRTKLVRIRKYQTTRLIEQLNFCSVKVSLYD